MARLLIVSGLILTFLFPLLYIGGFYLQGSLPGCVIREPSGASGCVLWGITIDAVLGPAVMAGPFISMLTVPLGLSIAIVGGVLALLRRRGTRSGPA